MILRRDGSATFVAFAYDSESSTGTLNCTSSTLRQKKRLLRSDFGVAVS
jgi:hypothetical protein